MKEPSGMIDGFFSRCLRVFLGVILLYLAVQVLKVLLPILIVILAVAGLAGLVWLGIVVFRTTRQKW
ncbi:hypothetical protein C5E45_29345 [Nocardia nova]|uniref:Uncharacterized protein n=1 Tax=Nocardia nova TaxID=37330 RepID=A0A2S6AHP6_9NOCA|nr:hypothetical protein [Nocardia nova]PPJ23143.1 hypothetical protein C5E41_25475 [Nocardia nova]PPJ34753.1 hypothetical protein C5E45_29345 [Nocardia nova]